MRDVVVTGIGLRCALGNLDRTRTALAAGRSAIALAEPFPAFGPVPLAMVGDRPLDLLDLVRPVVAEALADAQLQTPLPDCAVVLGSSRSQQGRLERWRLQPDDNWLELLPHMGAIAAARQIGATGIVLAPMAACATGLQAIAWGWELIRTGRCDRALVGAAEAPITPLTLAGFSRMGALAKTGVYPFDRDREGLAVGEGAAVLLLETAAAAAARGASVCGRISGVGLSADGHHVCATDPAGTAALSAVKQACDRGGCWPRNIDYIHAHGTATALNDRSEAQLIQQLFPPAVAVSSTKGATGHTLGASGALGAAFCLLAMKDGFAPPCVGLREPEFELNFIRDARPRNIENALCLSFGFGGQNAAILFRRG